MEAAVRGKSIIHQRQLSKVQVCLWSHRERKRKAANSAIEDVPSANNRGSGTILPQSGADESVIMKLGIESFEKKTIFKQLTAFDSYIASRSGKKMRSSLSAHFLT